MIYNSMNKALTFIAIIVLLFAFFAPFEDVIAKSSNEEKTIEVPVKIYTLQGVKEIRKELLVNEAMKLLYMANETKEAISMLFNKNASFMERMKANAIIDSFLYELKKNRLLGSMSIKEAKELITGKYLMKNRSSIEMQRLNAIAKFFQESGWQINAMCGVFAAGNIYNFHPWNFLLMVFIYWAFHQSLLPQWVLLLIPIYIAYTFVELFPHPTTIGIWIIERSSFYGHTSWIYTFGIFGEKSTPHSGKFIAFTLDFTGIVIGGMIAIGFCGFIAFKIL